MANDVTRRQLLAGTAGAFGMAALTPLAHGQGARRPIKRVKNIIFCVSDGMSASIPTMVDHLTLINSGKNSYWGWLMKQDFATNGLQDTRSLNSVVTDSAAASSAWGCGRHIWNGQVNMFPDGTALRPIAHLMHEAGVKVGLATTATITHATPAGFAVSHMTRDDESGIAERYLADGAVDVLLGGGAKHFDPTGRKDKRDLTGEFAKAGFAVCRTRLEMLTSSSSRLLGLFSDSHVPYSVDRDNDPLLMASVPALAEMAAAAIERLRKNRKGFLLQIEGARVDHGAHSNDLAAAVYDQIAFENAVKIAVDFAMADGETLVVITSDHANGNPGLNGAGDEYIASTAGLKTLNGMRASYGNLFGKIAKPVQAPAVQETVEALLGIQLSGEEAQVVADAAAGKSPFASSIFYGALNPTLAIVLGNHTKITWTSTNHTSDHVFVTAVGPGREAFAGLTQNTAMFDMMLAAKGLKHANPTMSFEDAAKAYEKWKAAGEPPPHWL